MNKELWKDAAQSFESSLMILRKDKNGWVIGFSVHPNDAPNALLTAPLGTRFRVVLFQIGDDEEPVVPPEVREAKKAVALAGELCRKESFQNFLLGPTQIRSEKETAQQLRFELGIESRSELLENGEARDRFREILKAYRTAAFEGDEYDF
jgi:hypothetical protein